MREDDDETEGPQKFERSPINGTRSLSAEHG